ncbi:MAG: VTT domain-containing protein [Pseudomonadota bacterium]
MGRIPTWSKWLIFVIVFITTIAIPALVLEGPAQAWGAEALAWAGDNPSQVSLLVVLALTADVMLPVPNGMTNTLAGAVLGWFWASVVVWLGLCLGTLFGYSVGRFAGRPLARRLVGAGDLEEAERMTDSVGVTSLILSRPVPAVAELVTLAAGITRMRFSTFLLTSAAANLGVAVVFAGIGAAALESGSATLAFVGAALLPALLWLGYKRYVR